MTYGDKRRLFSKSVGKLLSYMTEQGYEYSLGDTFPGKYKHKKDGQHPKGLAIDINLYKDRVWLTKTEDHKIFGDFWKRLGGTWGGDFTNPDGNHYEF